MTNLLNQSERLYEEIRNEIFVGTVEKGVYTSEQFRLLHKAEKNICELQDTLNQIKPKGVAHDRR